MTRAEIAAECKRTRAELPAAREAPVRRGGEAAGGGVPAVAGEERGEAGLALQQLRILGIYT